MVIQAARLLGVHKATLYRHMKALEMTRADLEQRDLIAVDELATEDQPSGEAHE
ncbi:MAG: hypothetical protein OEU26_22945 [Candidatus Tectomicrobia bacterium]|nr:hypothetical protein [Candidatus Tectomicrobia bacterium]